MDGFSEKLKTVLADPESMAKITEIAKGFAMKEQSETEKDDPRRSPSNSVGQLLDVPAVSQALRLLGDGSRERIALLCAMRPFVRDEKKAKLDQIISTMKTLDLLTSTQKLL